MKTALVYDRINKWGGAERVLLALHKIFPEAPVFTSVHSRQNTPWSKVFNVRTSSLQKIKFFQDNNHFIPLLMPSAFETFSFDKYDLVISISSEAAKGIITKPGTLHICYCLTPTRYLWSGHKDYFSNKYLRTIAHPAINYLRHWDKISSRRPDHFISISKEVQKRVKKYYGIDSDVIFPPVMLEKKSKRRENLGNHFLMVSRMSRFSYYKKVDLVIDAFNKSKLPLKIVGHGPMIRRFKNKASGNIDFLGELRDKELITQYEKCRALVFPGVEDFGLVMAEAQTFGKPVIAYRAGGALEIIVEGKTGEFFDRQSADSLASALKRFDEKRYNMTEIERNAKRFTFENFKTNFEKFLKDKINQI